MATFMFSDDSVVLTVLFLLCLLTFNFSVVSSFHLQYTNVVTSSCLKQGVLVSVSILCVLSAQLCKETQQK